MNTFIHKYGDWALITGASKGIGLVFSKVLRNKLKERGAIHNPQISDS